MDIKFLLEESVKQKASDLHLSPGSRPLLRLDGELISVQNSEILTPEKTKELIYGVMDENQQNIFETEKELDFAVITPDKTGFRVNAFQQINGVAAVFRIIPTTIPTLDSLGTPELFKKILGLSSGIILIAGPTGSGKSTTLAAMLNYINETSACHIITIEDPIEFVHSDKKSLINQRQVHRDTASFTKALRSALREDPDVILVGEMRDLETIRLALTAAETGHLVMATLHTSSSPQAISRIIDVFPMGEKNIIRNQLSQSLQAVICQTLLKKEEGGRIAAYEIMLGTPAIRNLIREDKIAQMYSVIQTSINKGMCTMEQSVKTLIDKKLINPEAAHIGGFQRELFEN